MKPIIPRMGADLMEVAESCGAVYICPKHGTRRMGPLVAYAGKDKKGRNYVGELYFNFRKVEEHPRVVQLFADAAATLLHGQGCLQSFDTVCGIPHGGRTFGQMLALAADKRFVYANKTPKPTEAGKKQEYFWDLSQFDFEPGERVAVAEDVYNNFQNTGDTLAQIADAGAIPVLLVGALNRSPRYPEVYVPEDGPFQGTHFPVVASIYRPFPEYEQDDPEVADDVAAGKIEYDVKKNWSVLRDLMAQF